MEVIRNIVDRYQGKIPKGVSRSADWPELRQEHLEKNPRCIVCGGKKKLEVHHVKPFHSHPHLELDEGNLATVCRSGKYGIKCHQLVGHLGNYRRVNTTFFKDAHDWNAKIKGV